MTLMQTPRFIDLDTEILRRLKEYLDKENASQYEAKGLRWELHPNYYWLELQIKK
jgi:hypothetical protein